MTNYTTYVKENFDIKYEKLKDAISILKEVYDKIPEKFRDKASIYVAYGEDYCEMSAEYARPENEQEKAIRLKRDEEARKYTLMRIKNDLKTLTPEQRKELGL
jgi:hypothetical protein